MRVALLTHEPFFPPSGGGSAAAVYLVEELTRGGHAVDVFGPPVAEGPGVEERFGIRLRPFTTWAMGRTTPLRTPKYLAYPAGLTRLVGRELRAGTRYDVLVAQHSISAVAAGRLKRRFQVPIVFNLLDCLTGFLETWPAWLMPRPFARALVRYELSLPRRCRADAVLAVSDPLRDRLVAQGFPAARIRPIYYGHDRALFHPRAAGGTRPAGPPVVVMHGSFDHHHLGRIAREAVAATACSRPETQFRFVGPRTPALRSFLKEVRAAVPGIAIEETGFTPYDRIPGQLETADVGITPYQPSTGTHCAFVAKTVEYLAMGLPVVCTPLESAVRYYDGLTGIAFSAADGASFAAALLAWLAQSPAERAAAVAPAQRKVAAELDWRTISRRAVEFIEQAAEAGPRRRSQAGPSPNHAGR